MMMMIMVCVLCCADIIYDEAFLENGTRSTSVSSKIGAILDRYESKLNLSYNFSCRTPVQKLIKVWSVLSEVKHVNSTDGQTDLFRAPCVNSL
jgi:hypothetical protein